VGAPPAAAGTAAWDRPVPAAVDAYWAAELACDPAALAGPGAAVTVLAGAAAERQPYALAFRRPAMLLLAVPPGWRAAAAAWLAGRDPAGAFDPGRLAAAFGAAATEVVGPAYQGWVDAAGFRPAAEAGVRRLGDGDRAALAELRRAAGETAWEHSALDPDEPPLFGRLEGATLVAAGTLTGWGGAVAHVGILTRPGHRGRGHGRAVVSAMTRAALAAGAVPHYQTLDANGPSLAVARALGYRRHASTLAVRLARPAP
jgi:GNAT superfamily N-acetyltransferase